MPKVALKSGVRLHYQQIGEGPDLVMIHGLTGNLAVWHLQHHPDDLAQLPHAHLRPPRARVQRHDADRLLRRRDGRGPARVAGCARDRARRRSSGTATAPTSRCTSRSTIRTGSARSSRSRRRFRPLSTPATATSGKGGTTGSTCSSARGTRCRPSTAPTRVYLLRASLDVPKKWGPLAGLPRNPKPFLRLIEETTVATEYEEVGSPDARADPGDRDARAAHVRRRCGVPRDARVPRRAPAERRVGDPPRDRVGPLRAARAARGRRRAPRRRSWDAASSPPRPLVSERACRRVARARGRRRPDHGQLDRPRPRDGAVPRRAGLPRLRDGARPRPAPEGARCGRRARCGA